MASGTGNAFKDAVILGAGIFFGSVLGEIIIGMLRSV